MLPDQGLYEERYRLTGSVTSSLAASLAMLALAVHGSQGAWLLLALLASLTVSVPIVVAMASRRVAFRADPLGITLGAEPLSWPGRGNSGVFIPWSDVDGIVIYRGQRSGAASRLCVGIRRRANAPPLPAGNGPARGCPVAGLAEGATRQAVAWRLDRERLAAFVAAVAPGIPIIDASGGIEEPDDPAIERPGKD